MAVIKPTKRNMTSGEARDHATRPSLRGRSYTYYGVSGEQIEADVDEFNETIFDNEKVSDLIADNEKGALLDKRDAGEIQSKLVRRGKGSEWETGVISLTEDESKQLKEEGPDAVTRFKNVLGEAINNFGGSGWHVQAMVSEEHDDTDNLHFHYYMHLIPRDEDGNTGPVIDMTKGGPQNQLKEWLDRSVKAEGFGYIDIYNVHDAEVTGKFKTEAYAPQQTEYDPGKSNIANARQTSIQQDTLKRGLATLQKQAQEAAEAAQIAAQRVEEYEQLLAAQVQIEDAQKERDAALKAQEKAEAERVEAVERAAKVEVDAAAQIEAANAAKIEAEAISQEQTEKAEAAEKRSIELASDLEQEREAKENLADQLAEVQQEVEPLRAENATLQERLERLEAQQKELADDLKASRRETMDYQQQATAALNELEAKTEFYENRDREQVKEVTGLRHQLSELKESVAAELKALKDALTGSLNDVFAWRKREGIDDRKELGQIISQTRKPKNDNDNDGGGKPKP